MTIFEKSTSKSTTKSGVEILITTFDGKINEFKVSGEFIIESSISWKTSTDNGLSSDEWRKEYSVSVASHTEKYAIPHLRKLCVGRSVSCTSKDINDSLQEIGVDVIALWQMVDSH